jgi:beta-glucanase (GH16 family)
MALSRACVCLALFGLVQPHAAQAACKGNLIFSEEFNGSQLDTTRWDTYYPTYAGELQYYSPDAFEFRNGTINIRADTRHMNGYNYTSGMLTTYGSFSQLHGYYEIRAKLPRGAGLWPAFWLLPDPRGISVPELDVFEFRGFEPNTIYMSNHWLQNGQVLKQTTYYKDGPDYTQDFHTFALDWGPSVMHWYVDGVLRRTMTQGVSTVPMVLLVNLAIGGSWVGAPDANTPFPSYYQIDYVRVYENTSCRAFLPITRQRR